MSLLTLIFGLMRALQPSIGINLGVEKHDRVNHPYGAVLGHCKLILNLMLPAKDFLASDLLNFRIFMAMTFFPAINNSNTSINNGFCTPASILCSCYAYRSPFLGVGWVYRGSFLIDFVIILWVVSMETTEFRKLKRGKVRQPKAATEAV